MDRMLCQGVSPEFITELLKCLPFFLRPSWKSAIPRFLEKDLRIVGVWLDDYQLEKAR